MTDRRPRALAHQSIVIAGIMVAVAAACAPSDAAGPDAGFLYGTVVTTSGDSYTGFLRWGDQEACWDDLFQSLKTEVPYLEYPTVLKEKPRKRHKKQIEVLGLRMTIEHDEDSTSRILICRFGDLARIDPDGDGDATLHLRDGSTLVVSGYSDDVTSDIGVLDATVGDISLHWDKIESITFAPVPRGASRGVRRLQGEVETDAGRYTGYVQWDKSECLSSDKLDGDTEDGRLAIAMGEIASIERDGRSHSRVMLRDGRELRLGGTNDVDDDNRGLLVEDPRYGKIEVPWKAFDRVSFTEESGSGLGYDAYPAAGPLHGTVVDTNSKSHRGRLVFDLDETAGWEMLNGSVDDVAYNIPFLRIARVEPQPGDRCEVTLRDGTTVVLADSHDVGADNSGLLVFPGDGDGDGEYIAWDRVAEIHLDW